MQRRPVAPNNRQGSMWSQFLSSLESQVTSAKFPKAKESPRIKVYAQRGKQNSEGFGGGRVVGK